MTLDDVGLLIIVATISINFCLGFLAGLWAF